MNSNSLQAVAGMREINVKGGFGITSGNGCTYGNHRAKNQKKKKILYRNHLSIELETRKKHNSS